jgi:hypothetical protein
LKNFVLVYEILKNLENWLFFIDIEIQFNSLFNKLVYSQVSEEMKELELDESKESKRVQEIIKDIKKSIENEHKIPLSMLTMTIPEDDEKKIDNVLFYQGKIRARPMDKIGLTIDEIHEQWFGKYDILEQNHDYIQWLFPNREGGMNIEAQPLSKYESTLFKNSNELISKVIKSYELMFEPSLLTIG